MEKRSKSKLLICLCIMVLATALIVGAIFLLGGKKETIAPPSPNNETDKNKVEDTIVVDGALDEKIWSSQRKLTSVMKTDKNVTINMTTYFGEKGVYFAFEVKDPKVYYSETRDASSNTGVEFYVSPMAGASNINNYGYEIDINAGGLKAIKKYVNDAYAKVHAEFDAAAKVQGKINSGEAEGYTAEVLVPYDLLGGKCDQVYAMPAIVRSLSAEGTDYLWYCFGIEDRAAEWHKASTWWIFGKDGLDAHDVTFDIASKGKVEGNDYVVDGDDYKFELAPDKGYYASSVKVNDKDVTNDLLFEDGKAYYIVEEANEDLDIKIKYAIVPNEKMSVTGKVTDGQKGMPIAKLYAVKGGYSQEIKVKTDGTFSAEIPDMDGMKISAQAKDFVTTAVDVKKGSAVNIVMEKLHLGKNKEVQHNKYNEANWDFTRLYQNRLRATTRAYNETIMNTKIYENAVWAESYITLPKREHADTRAGFYLVDKEGNDLFVALTMSNEKGQYYYALQFISRKGTHWEVEGRVDDIAGDEVIKKLANNKEGVRLLVAYENGVVNAWVHDRSVAANVVAKDKGGKSIFSAGEKVAIGIQSWNNKTAFNKLTFGTGKVPADKVPSLEDAWARDWDLTKLSKGEAYSLKDKGQSKVLIHTGYRSKVCVSGTITLPVAAGQDTRTGFWFRTADGRDVFCSLTCENQKGQKNYKLQFIGNEASSWARIWEQGWEKDLSKWKFPGESVDYSVYYENGEITVWLDGEKAAFGVHPVDKNGKKIFAPNDKVAVGLQSWECKTTFKNLKLSVSSPDWNLGKLSEGKAQCKATDQPYTMLTTEKKTSVYASANVILPKEDNADTRAGFRFEDENGRHVFVALLMENSYGQYNYRVQFIGQERNGSQLWDAKGTFTSIEKVGMVKALANSTKGVPFEVEYINGKFNVWLNGQQIAKDAFVTKDGNAWLAADVKMTVGLACWNYPATFTNIATGDKKK